MQPDGPFPDEAYGDLVARALKADADAARAEIRAQGITCPSCGVNMADLPEGHRLAVIPGLEDGFAECRDGQRADITGSGPLQMAANVSLWDTTHRLEAESFKRIIGDGPGDYTGLLDILKGS